MHKAGHTHSIYATFNNGLAYEFIEGDTLTVDTVRKPEVYELVAKRMAEMHLLWPNTDQNRSLPVIWQKTEKFMQLMPKKFDDPEKQKKLSTKKRKMGWWFCTKINLKNFFFHADLKN